MKLSSLDRETILEEVYSVFNNYIGYQINEDTLKMLRNDIYRKLWELNCRGIRTTRLAFTTEIRWYENVSKTIKYPEVYIVPANDYTWDFLFNMENLNEV